jgi:hypothetical protein
MKCLTRACLGNFSVLATQISNRGAQKAVFTVPGFRRRPVTAPHPSHSCNKTGFFECFSYVCPEPVLVKSSF